nr:hypothetical protein [uncultured Draconibacterium sp.]
MTGGQATNSGIDYQQRIAAWCLINQYAEFSISTFFDQIDEEYIISKTLFETNHPIDDLNLQCQNNKTIFLQIKRSLSLSLRESSDFYKTIKQFTQEYIKSERAKNIFGLITTSDASSKITHDLKKIVVSIKLNENAFDDNPLNESEKDTLNKVEKVFNSIYKEIRGLEPTREKFIEFIKKIFVAIIDIQTGHPLEISSLMLLRSIGFKNPEIVWSILIKNSLIYASNRQSINSNKLSEIFDKYKENEIDKSSTESELEFLKTELISQGDFPVGKEVLLIESFIDEMDYMIVELYRFRDDCQIKNRFRDNKIIISEDTEWTVVQRFATMTGLERYMEENQERFVNKKVAVIEANEIETVENDKCSELHKTLLADLMEKNTEILSCLHCGKFVNDKDTLTIEVEDLDTPPTVGIVHKNCLRPIDRVLGAIKIPGRKNGNFLDTFDYKLWVSLVVKGQGMLNALKASPNMLDGHTPVVGWNSDEEYDTDYSYCIKFNLEDGSTSYSYQRSKIERLNKLQAKEHLKLFKRTQEKAKQENDPWCVLSQNKTAAPYSRLIKIKKPEEEILEIVSAEITKYSKLIAKAFDKDIAHYTPLCLVRDVETETIINLSNVVPIVSNPMQFNDLIKNWETFGFKFEPMELKIIKTDKDFDYYMRMILGDDRVPIIDPYFDRNFKLIKGYPIQDINQMIAQ